MDGDTAPDGVKSAEIAVARLSTACKAEDIDTDLTHVTPMTSTSTDVKGKS